MFVQTKNYSERSCVSVLGKFQLSQYEKVLKQLILLKRLMKGGQERAKNNSPYRLSTPSPNCA